MRPLLFAALLSCGGDDAIHWQLPPDITDEERADFGEACERWNFVAIRQQYIAEPGEGTHRLFLRLPKHMVNGPDAHGEYQAAIHVMNLQRGMPRPQFVMVATHELGHVLGLARGHRGPDGAYVDGHLPPPALMSAHAGQIEFSEADIEECRRVNACR